MRKMRASSLADLVNMAVLLGGGALAGALGVTLAEQAHLE